MNYPSQDQTFVPSLKASPELMISYPGWVIGVIPDYAAAADKIAGGEKPSDLTVFTVDGEHFQDAPDGLMVVKGPDAADRLRAAGARINEKYVDSVIWVFGITYNSGGEAVDMAATMPHNYVFTLDDLSGLDKIENRITPKYSGYMIVDGVVTLIPEGATHVSREMPSTLFGKPVVVEDSPNRRAIRIADPARPWHPAAAGRNDRCPCGSGRKYKRCCMRK